MSQVEVFWFVILCSVAVGYKPQHYMASQPIRPRLKSLLPSEPEILHQMEIRLKMKLGGE
jgi:hypothetical protein